MAGYTRAFRQKLVPQQRLQRLQRKQDWCRRPPKAGNTRTLPELCDLVGERVPPVLRLAIGPLLACTNAAVMTTVVCDGRESGPTTRRRLHLVALQRNGVPKHEKAPWLRKTKEGHGARKNRALRSYFIRCLDTAENAITERISAGVQPVWSRSGFIEPMGKRHWAIG